MPANNKEQTLNTYVKPERLLKDHPVPLSINLNKSNNSESYRTNMPNKKISIFSTTNKPPKYPRPQKTWIHQGTPERPDKTMNETRGETALIWTQEQWSQSQESDAKQKFKNNPRKVLNKEERKNFGDQIQKISNQMTL